MKKVNEYTRDRFTDEEVLIAENVAKVVCHVFGVTMEELRSDVRVRPVPDARKVISHYLSKHIRLQKVQGRYHVALATWFLNQDHSTISYSVKQADALYKTDIFFKSAYDNVVSILNNPDDYELNIVVPKSRKDLTWEDVRRSNGHNYETKKRMMPAEVSDRLKEMYERKYGLEPICRELMIGMPFLKSYIAEMGLERKELYDNPARLTISKRRYDVLRAPTRTVCKTIDY